MADGGETRPLVIGIGNELRSDDGAGLVVVRCLQDELAVSADFMEHWGEGAALMDDWRGRSFVIVIDAAVSDAPAGSLHELDANTTEVPRELLRKSTHRFGVAEAVELSRSLNQLPPRLILLAIEGGDFSHGNQLSPAVAKAVERTADRVRQLLASV